MSPMTTYGLPDPDGSSNAHHRAYYERRAASGIGLVIVESAMVHPSGACWPHHLAIHDDRFVPGLAELARGIKRHGPAAILQLHHGGRVAVEALSGSPLLAPSPLAAPGRPVPREMSRQDIELMVDAFGRAAQRARDAGFDGVELHMGTAYLLLSFLSPAQNVRQDEYGGDFEGRMRFPLEIVERIQQVVGTDFPLGARIVGSDYHDGGVDLDYCTRVARRLEEAGLAFLDVSAGVGPRAVRDSPLVMGGGDAVFADFAAAVKVRRLRPGHVRGAVLLDGVGRSGDRCRQRRPDRLRAGADRRRGLRRQVPERPRGGDRAVHRLPGLPRRDHHRDGRLLHAEPGDRTRAGAHARAGRPATARAGAGRRGRRSGSGPRGRAAGSRRDRRNRGAALRRAARAARDGARRRRGGRRRPLLPPDAGPARRAHRAGRRPRRARRDTGRHPGAAGRPGARRPGRRRRPRHRRRLRPGHPGGSRAARRSRWAGRGDRLRDLRGRDGALPRGGRDERDPGQSRGCRHG